MHIVLGKIMLYLQVKREFEETLIAEEKARRAE
jgi:hypothetical protein